MPRASACRATIHLATTPEQVNLRVEDDGQGFDPMQVPKGRYGLIGLNERVRLLGGSMQVRTTPGRAKP